MCIIARSYLSSPSVYFKLSTLDLSVRLRVTTGGFVNGKLYVKRGWWWGESLWGGLMLTTCYVSRLLLLVFLMLFSYYPYSINSCIKESWGQDWREEKPHMVGIRPECEAVDAGSDTLSRLRWGAIYLFYCTCWITACSSTHWASLHRQQDDGNNTAITFQDAFFQSYKL